jgi:hypothetical protein
VDLVALLAEAGISPASFFDTSAETTHGTFVDLLARAEHVSRGTVREATSRLGFSDRLACAI